MEGSIPLFADTDTRGAPSKPGAQMDPRCRGCSMRAATGHACPYFPGHLDGARSLLGACTDDG